MRIAVNTIHLKGDKFVAVDYFINKIFSRLAKQYPEHEFLFLVNKENCNLPDVVGSGIKLMFVSANPKNVFSLKYWNEVKLPFLLRSVRPDILMQPFGCYSYLTNVDQLLIVNEKVLEKHPFSLSSLYYHRMYRQYFKRAKRIVALSEFCKSEIVALYKVDPEKIDVVIGAAKEIYQPVAYSIQQDIKEKYTTGMEYFLYEADYQLNENLENLFKAFSQFKKWQHSNMNLIIITGISKLNDKWIEKLKLYKHRKEVVFLEDLSDEELANITASAYALLFPSFSGGLRLSAIDAVQCGTPVIMDNKTSRTEARNSAFLYADKEKPESIAKQMLQLYKDESSRYNFIKEGKSLASQFSWDKSAALIWQSISKVIAQ